MKDYGKSYSSIEEMTQKYQVFKKNYLAAKLQYEEMDSKEELSYGASEFMDMTPEEFEKQYLTLKGNEVPTDYEVYYHGNQTENTEEFLKNRNLQEQSEEIPESFDWRTKGAVSPVRTQGGCGSCWAFSSISNIESQYFIKYGVLPNLSEQQLIDCDSSNSGCSGGIIHYAFNHIRLNGGLVPESKYSYLGFNSYCKFNPNDVVVKVKAYQMAGTMDEEIIKEMLYKQGPLAITINARTLQYYTGGIINLPYAYCPYAPNHGVNLVGYGVSTTGLKYWIVRNTWGAYWGEGGYFRIARGRGLCGVNAYISTAIIE
jgi:cathepsin F